MKKTTFIRIVSIILAFVFVLSGCTEKRGKTALEYVDPSGKITGTADQSFLSFIIATLNYQHGAADISDKSVWDAKIEGETTVRDLIRAEAVSYAKMFLQAEYLHDKVYALGLDDKREDAVNKAVDAMIAAYGSEENLAAFLSTYGAGIKDIKRYMTLSIKQETLEDFLYSDPAKSPVTEQAVEKFFGENYNIADYICISLTGGVKDDGSVIPLTSEELEEKNAAIDGVYNLLMSGGIEFEEAMELYSEADYSSVYPEGYFIPNNGTAEGLRPEVSEGVRSMKVDEIKKIETSTAVFIVKKRAMNSALYKTKEGFGKALRAALESDDFVKQLGTADGVSVNENIVAELDPAAIPPLSLESFAG